MFHIRTCMTRQQLSLPRRRRLRGSWRKTLSDLSLISKCAARGLTSARWASSYFKKNVFQPSIVQQTLCWNKYQLPRVPHTIVVPRYFLSIALHCVALHCCRIKSWSESCLSFHLSCFHPPVVRLTNWLICSWWSIDWNNPPIFWKCHHCISQKPGLI